MRIIAHLYDSYTTAAEVARALESAGFEHDAVSVVANQAAVPATDASTVIEDDTTTPAGTGTGTGASIGTLIGGGAGLLAGIGALAIPGVGPVVAAGWLVATLTGAGAGAGIGGLVGALADSGVRREHAHVYAEGVRRGDILVTVRAGDDVAKDAEKIMQDFGPVDVAAREASYRADDGWTSFDESRGALTPEELEAERMRAGRAPF
jgi:hypothetical protein